jgi:hypothetical protein
VAPAAQELEQAVVAAIAHGEVAVRDRQAVAIVRHAGDTGAVYQNILQPERIVVRELHAPGHGAGPCRARRLPFRS